MLAIMRGEEATQQRRDWAAEKAAPYVHPRLQATTIKGEGDNGEINVGVTIKYVGADNGKPAGKA
jgi:hypothetical protein